MLHNFNNNNDLCQTIVAILLAVAGGLARILNAKDRKVIKWSVLLAELFLSGFIGYMMVLFVNSIGIEGDWVGLTCGISGWIGPRMLTLVVSKMFLKLGFTEKTEKIEKNDKE